MKIKDIIYYLSVIILISTSFYFGGIIGLLELIFFIVLYASILYLIYLLWKRFRKKEKIKYIEYVILFSKKASLSFIIIGTILGGLAYYVNEISPAPMPRYTISNGDKTVIFQGMSHIGSTNFYDSVVTSLTEAKKEGYVLYFEGIKPGSKKNMDDFNKALGIKFDENLYKNFSKIYGVHHQDNKILFGLINEKDYNIDISLDNLMKMYNELNKTNSGAISEENIELPVDISKDIIDKLSELNEKELKILVYINKAILNLILASDGTKDLILNNFGNQLLFEVILDNRNEVLSKEIIESEHKKIFVTYGLMHFDGVFELLKKNDSTWKITERTDLYPIQ